MSTRTRKAASPSATQYAPRIPYNVRGGIRAQNVRSQASRKWWAKRWISYLEEQQLGARLGRGRSYALSGQVLTLEITPGLAKAVVQGGAKEAYTCEIRFEIAKPKAKERIVDRLLARPMLISQLLIHSLPEEVERLFRAEGYPLLPSTPDAFEASCTCPDPINPCKHLAAVLFILIEAIEQNPLLLLELRGITLADLTDGDSIEGGKAEFKPDEGDTLVEEAASSSSAEGEEEPEDFESDPVFFWRGAEIAPPDYGPAPAQNTKMPLVQRLGPIPFWRGDQRFVQTLEQCGERASTEGWEVWAGESLHSPSSPQGGDGNSRSPRKVRAVRLDEM